AYISLDLFVFRNDACNGRVLFGGRNRCEVAQQAISYEISKYLAVIYQAAHSSGALDLELDPLPSLFQPTFQVLRNPIVVPIFTNHTTSRLIVNTVNLLHRAQ